MVHKKTCFLSRMFGKYFNSGLEIPNFGSAWPDVAAVLRGNRTVLCPCVRVFNV